MAQRIHLVPVLFLLLTFVALPVHAQDADDDGIPDDGDESGKAGDHPCGEGQR